jgi:CheY-like chemotaxis protein
VKETLAQSKVHTSSVIASATASSSSTTRTVSRLSQGESITTLVYPTDVEKCTPSGVTKVVRPRETDRGVSVGPRCRTYIESMRKRILFIDDDELVREALTENLEIMGFDVTTEETGEKGLQTLISHPDDYGLVLTDLLMSDIRGDDIAGRIRSVRPDLPVVVMTGTPQFLSPEDAKASGVYRVLGKPVTRAELNEGLERALSHDC